MENFIISIIGGFVSAGLVALIGRFAPPQAKPAVAAEPEPYSKPRAILAASSFAVAAWATMVAFLLAIALAAYDVYSSDQLITVLFGTLICTCAFYIFTASLLKCSHCERRIFFQWKQGPPPHSIKFKGMSGWASIVLQVLLKREFQCMHCGKKYKVGSNT